MQCLVDWAKVCPAIGCIMSCQLEWCEFPWNASYAMSDIVGSRLDQLIHVERQYSHSSLNSIAQTATVSTFIHEAFFVFSFSFRTLVSSGVSSKVVNIPFPQVFSAGDPFCAFPKQKKLLENRQGQDRKSISLIYMSSRFPFAIDLPHDTLNRLYFGLFFGFLPCLVRIRQQ